MNATRNSLPTATRKDAVRILNSTVADLFDLYARTKQAHWNLRGQSFFALHRLLDEFEATTQEHIDSAAERATALGGIVEGTLRDTVKHSRLKKRRNQYQNPASATGFANWLTSTQPAVKMFVAESRSSLTKMTSGLLIYSLTWCAIWTSNSGFLRRTWNESDPLFNSTINT